MDRRLEKELHRLKKNPNYVPAMPAVVPIDCACVIHSDKYEWQYVEKLYNMLSRNITRGIRFHVYTEHDRSVPPHMIKHCLDDWNGISGPKKSWWYKLQLFNPVHHAGPMLYFDLDCVVVRDLTWIAELSLSKFWCLRDFRYLQSPMLQKMNSSVMWWDTRLYSYVWDKFVASDIQEVVRTYHGDQDYIEVTINYNDRRFFDERKFQSYRWEVAEGGVNFQTKQPRLPGRGPVISGECAALIFHGNPKPHQVRDAEIVQLWY